MPEIPGMWHVHGDKCVYVPKLVLREPNKIFCRADSMRSPHDRPYRT